MARILVIDDEEMVRGMFRLALELGGHEVVEAADGEEGVRLYREAPTDLVITDIKMPRTGGLEVIQDLRDDFPDVKIIAITGYEPENLNVARQLGALHTFEKPLNMGEFMQIVKEVLEGDS